MKQGPNKTKAWRKTGEGRKSIASNTFIPSPSFKVQEMFVRGMMAGNIMDHPTKKQVEARAARAAAKEAEAATTVEVQGAE